MKEDGESPHNFVRIQIYTPTSMPICISPLRAQVPSYHSGTGRQGSRSRRSRWSHTLGTGRRRSWSSSASRGPHSTRSASPHTGGCNQTTSARFSRILRVLGALQQWLGCVEGVSVVFKAFVPVQLPRRWGGTIVQADGRQTGTRVDAIPPPPRTRRQTNRLAGRSSRTRGAQRARTRTRPSPRTYAKEPLSTLSALNCASFLR